MTRKKIKKLSKNRRVILVERCVEDHIETAREGGAHEDDWLRKLLTEGFLGFANMSDADLERAYEDAGLVDEYYDEDHDAEPCCLVMNFNGVYKYLTKNKSAWTRSWATALRAPRKDVAELKKRFPGAMVSTITGPGEYDIDKEDTDV